MDIVQHILPSIEHFGVLGYWFVFFSAFLETLVVVGLIYPGSFVVVFFGFLAAQGYFDFGDLIWFAALGAILGDNISFYLGSKGTHLFKNENRILRESHLRPGRAFFQQHGDKSIFMARFIGPLGAIVPFCAGLSRMDRTNFWLWSTSSAFAWAIAHLLIGYFFGGTLDAMSVLLGRFGLFIGALFVLLIGIWFLARKSTTLIRALNVLCQSSFRACIRTTYAQRFIHTHPRITRWIRDRFNRRRFSGLPLTIICISFFYVLFSLGGLIQDVIASDPIVSLDKRLADLLYIFRDEGLITFFFWITLLAKAQMVIATGLALSAVLYGVRKNIYIWALWFSLIGQALFVYLGKTLIHRMRPTGYLPVYHESSLSFPSGHASASVVLYGFIIYILLKQQYSARIRTLILCCGALIIFLIGISRMYLGVHFFSDVLGGYLVGALWLLIAITISEWFLYNKQTTQTSRRIALPLSVTMIISICGFYLYYGLAYNPPLTTYTPTYSTIVTTQVSSLFTEDRNLPTHVEGLVGSQQEPISFILLAANDTQLIGALQHAGWYRADAISPHSLGAVVRSVVMQQPYANAPVTPLFWNGRVQHFSFEKGSATDTLRAKHHVRIWRTSIKTTNGQFIYVATASLDTRLKWFVTHKIDEDIDTQRELLLRDLQTTGAVNAFQQIPMVQPIRKTNNTDDDFYTDGNAYLLSLNST